MLNWILGYVKRWGGIVADPVIDLVHWAIHAIAGVVYTVFNHVGAAWLSVYHAALWLHKAINAFSYEVWAHLWSIITRDLPGLFHTALSWYRAALKWADRLYHILLHALAVALATARRWVDDATRWVVDHVWRPLKAAVADLWRNLIKWGYTAWYYVTHPDKLAPILIRPMIRAAEDVFWDVAAPVGNFAFRIVLANSRRFVHLVETILAAVL